MRGRTELGAVIEKVLDEAEGSGGPPPRRDLRDRLIYEARIGVGGKYGRTYASIGLEYGLSPQRVRQLAVAEWRRLGEPGCTAFRHVARKRGRQ